MLIANQLVEVKWNNKTRKHYENLGYVFSKAGEPFQVKAEDLTTGSKVKIKLICDFCKGDIDRQYGNYIRQVSESETSSVKHYDTCSKCYKQKAELSIKNKLTLQEEMDLIEKYRDSVSLVDIRRCFKITDSKIYEILNKHGIGNKRETWSERHSKRLKEIYEYEEWDFILNELSPFKANTITEKAMRLGLSRKNLFSEEEIAILESNYSSSSFEELMKMLPNRTVAAIQSKANDLGIKKREYWSDEDIEKFKEIYPLFPNSELINHFSGRSESSLLSMAGILNIHKTAEAFDYYRDGTKSNSLDKLIEFANKLGRTPTSEDITHNSEMPGIVTYHRQFGSYANACELANLEVNTNIYGKSFISKSINGDVCLSKSEKVITDILINNSIAYEKEKPYKEIFPNGTIKTNIRCDWYINNILVEYFGMPEKDSYFTRMKNKIELCTKNNIPLIDLYPDDLRNGFKGLFEKFSKHGIELSN